MARPRELEDPRPEKGIRISDNPNYRRFRDTDYYIGRMGDIWRMRKKKDVKINPYFKESGRIIRYCITYTRSDKKRTWKPVKNFVWEAFKGEIPNGYVVYNKNGMKTDNALTNLAIMPLEEYGRHYGPRTARTRYVLDTQTGKIYLGLRAAGEATGYTRQGVLEIVKGEAVKSGRFKYLKKRPYEKNKE